MVRRKRPDFTRIHKTDTEYALGSDSGLRRKAGRGMARGKPKKTKRAGRGKRAYF